MSGDSTTPELPEYEKLDPIPLRFGFIVIVFSFCLFRVVRVILDTFGTPGIITEKERLKWLNLTVSVVHSSIVTIWLTASSWYYPELFIDPVAFHNLFIYSLIAFSTGYFIVDFYDIAETGQTKIYWEVLVHHVVVIFIFVYNMISSRYIGASVIALFVEVNSVPLHSRKLMQMFGVDYESLHYRIVCLINLATFVCFRFTAVSYIMYMMYAYGYRMSFVFTVSLSVTMVITWIINGVLFWRLVKSDVLRKVRSAKAKNERKDGTDGVSEDSGNFATAINNNNTISNGSDNGESSMTKRAL